MNSRFYYGNGIVERFTYILLVEFFQIALPKKAYSFLA